MTGSAHLDLRLPIGGLFVSLGALLGGHGLYTRGDAVRYAGAGGFNINLWWGGVLLATGLLFLVGALRPARRDRHD